MAAAVGMLLEPYFPSLFGLFIALFRFLIKDILDDILNWVNGSIYEEGLVIWYSAEYVTTAKVRIQGALKKIEKGLQIN